MFSKVISFPCIWTEVNINFQKVPRQFDTFVNAKRKSSALPSSVRLNSIEAFTDVEIVDLYAEYFYY